MLPPAVSQRAQIDDGLIEGAVLSRFEALHERPEDRVLVAQGYLAVASAADQAAERTARQATANAAHVEYMRLYPIQKYTRKEKLPTSAQLSASREEEYAEQQRQFPGSIMWGVLPELPYRKSIMRIIRSENERDVDAAESGSDNEYYTN